MADNSSIEWTEATWNPVAGCTIVSPGCTNCYAMRLAGRLKNMGVSKYDGLTRKTGGRQKWNGQIFLDHDALAVPAKWKRGRHVFVNSMSDLFHEQVPADFIQSVFAVMSEHRQHKYQVLTKRPERLLELHKSVPWTENIWMGVSVENEDYTWRIDMLRESLAQVKFLSIEPLIGPLQTFDFSGIDWVIVGGESGPGARPMEVEWVRDVRDACLDQDVAFHFKQWGGTNKKKTGRTLDNRTWDELPGSQRQGNEPEPAYAV